MLGLANIIPINTEVYSMDVLQKDVSCWHSLITVWYGVPVADQNKTVNSVHVIFTCTLNGLIVDTKYSL